MSATPERTLYPDVLRYAYAHGFFPMPYGEDDAIHWFSPDPRAIIPLGELHQSRSLRRAMRHTRFTVSFDRAFTEVMKACGDRPETWITTEFLEAYTELHEEGDAHSVEIWDGSRLVGGVYGVSLASAFFAESMFHRETNASKMALVHLRDHLVQRGFTLLETQFLTPHLESMGAIGIPANEYMKLLQKALLTSARF
jgi:leucyl/phenylalanyl-tRNA--protein transferase